MEQKMPQRLQSLDALRGFDMLFIMGGAPFFIALATLFPCPFFDAIAGQMDHVYLTLKYLKQKMSRDDFYML